MQSVGGLIKKGQHSYLNVAFDYLQICSPREQEQIELQLALLIDTRFVSARRVQRSTVCFRFSLSAIRSPYCLGENRAIKSNFLPRVMVNVKQHPPFGRLSFYYPRQLYIHPLM